jgi:hypothetical protein
MAGPQQVKPLLHNVLWRLWATVLALQSKDIGSPKFTRCPKVLTPSHRQASFCAAPQGPCSLKNAGGIWPSFATCRTQVLAPLQV